MNYYECCANLELIPMMENAEEARHFGREWSPPFLSSVVVFVLHEARGVPSSLLEFIFRHHNWWLSSESRFYWLGALLVACHSFEYAYYHTLNAEVITWHMLMLNEY